MEEGYLFSGGPIGWVDKKPSFWVRKGYDVQGITVAKDTIGLGADTKSYRCPRCEIIITPYKKETKETEQSEEEKKQ